MASGDYVKTEFHNGAPPAINNTALNNNENKTKELDNSMLAAETTIASLVASEAMLTDFRAYDPTRAYAINDPTFYLGVPYKSIFVGANTGNTPSTSPTYWEVTGGGPPVVRAEYKNHGVIASGNPLKYSIPIEDTHSSYNSSTGYFTAPIAGIYAITATVATGGTPGNIILSSVLTGERAALGSSSVTNVYGAGAGSVRLVAGEQICVQLNGTSTVSEQFTTITITRIGS